MMHIGNRSSMRTYCGKSVERRWWCEDEHLVARSSGLTGGFSFRIGEINQHTGVWQPVVVDCSDCVVAFKERKK